MNDIKLLAKLAELANDARFDNFTLTVTPGPLYSCFPFELKIGDISYYSSVLNEEALFEAIVYIKAELLRRYP